MVKRIKEIKIVAIIGSIRPNNFTAKAMGLVVDEIKKHGHISLEVIDPRELRFALPGREGDSSAELLQKIVTQATGVIISSPEYHGSYSSAIKLVIDNLGYPSVLSGKPVALLGVASGQIGAIKALEHLRSVCSHVGAIVLPGPVSVAGVNRLFDEQGRCLDEKVEKRIRSVAANLIDYIEKNICPRKALEEFVRGN
jgi:chromate reductase, NAD(P)H dehydrogenase (quinone)